MPRPTPRATRPGAAGRRRQSQGERQGCGLRRPGAEPVPARQAPRRAARRLSLRARSAAEHAERQTPSYPDPPTPGPALFGGGADLVQPAGIGQAPTMPEIRLNLRGLKCPLPALKTRKALKSLAPGDLLVVECTDPLAAIDIPALLQETRDILEGQEAVEGALAFRIRKAAPSARS